jgi:beta-glucanase (GH16 family)
MRLGVYALVLQLLMLRSLLPSQVQAPRAPSNVRVISGTSSGPFAGSDTFDAPLDTTNWAILDREGDLSNSELQCYKPANQTVSGGFLVLTIKSQAVTCNSHSYAYTSSMVQWKSFNFKYGALEVRAKMPGGSGTWPAIWLLGANCQATNIISANDSGACVWPQPGSDEIDVAEFSSSDRLHVNQQIHSSSNNPGCQPAISDASQSFHVYRFEWGQGTAVWKVDGVQTCRVTSSVPSTPMFLMLNIASHGSVSGLPQTMSVDYVTVTPQ